MRQLRFDDIIASIKKAKNKYEEEHGIATLNVYLLDRKDNLAFFLADKSDNSKTLYFAIQPNPPEDHWVWCCPNKEHVEFLTDRLSEHIEKNSLSQNLQYSAQIVFNSSDDIINELKKTIDDGYNIDVVKKGETTVLISATGSESHLFIAIKPSIRFGHWYLFLPSNEQIQLIIDDLGKIYSKTDSKNDLTRWK